jgi:hypothetical protein
MINKKFKTITRRDFNLALTKLKGLKCEVANVIHPFIFQIGDHDFTISDDIYYILDQYGNIYQAIKIEITIQGFYERFIEIRNDIEKMLQIFDPTLISEPVKRKIQSACEKNKDIISYLREEKIKLSNKFDIDKIEKDNEIYKIWKEKLLLLLNLNIELNNLEKNLDQLKNIYSGKNKKYSYLQFIEKVSFNEENILTDIQTKLIKFREDIIEIKSKMASETKKDLKLLNLDYERLIVMSDDD